MLPLGGMFQPKVILIMVLILVLDIQQISLMADKNAEMLGQKMPRVNIESGLTLRCWSTSVYQRKMKKQWVAETSQTVQAYPQETTTE